METSSVRVYSCKALIEDTRLERFSVGLPVTNGDAQGLPTWAKQTVRANIRSWRIFVRTKKGEEKGAVHLTRLACVVTIGNAIFYLRMYVSGSVCVCVCTRVSGSVCSAVPEKARG